MQRENYRGYVSASAVGTTFDSPPTVASVRAVPSGLYWLVALAIGSSFYVVVEPAPVDLLFLALLAVVVCRRNLRFPVDLNVALSSALLIFVAINTVSILWSSEPMRGLFYYSITMYLVVLWYVVVVLLSNYGYPMLILILRAFLVAATLAATIGLVSHFAPVLNDLLYLRPYGVRATSTFKDPNVYAPFLCAGIVLVINELVTRPWQFSLRPLLALALLGILSAETLGALSRGAYVNVALSLAVYLFLQIFVVQNKARILRSFILICLGALVILPVLSVYLSATGLESLFTQRLGLQSYDHKRFAVQTLTFSILSTNLFGIGPGQSEIVLPQGTHNLYLRVMLENGILAAFAFYTFLGVTLWICFRNAWRRSSAFQDVYVCCFAILTGMLVNSLVIDSLHWRHMFLFLAIPIGLAHYERRNARLLASVDVRS